MSVAANHSDPCLAGGWYEATASPPRYANDVASMIQHDPLGKEFHGSYNCDSRSQIRQEYAWRLPTPNACYGSSDPGRPFSAVSYCDALSNQTILYVGDSTQAMMYFSLYSMARAESGEQQPLNGTDESHHKGYRVGKQSWSATLCDGRVTANYVRDDYLHLNRYWHAATADVLVLNRGIHVVSDQVLEHDMLVMAQKLSQLLERRPTLRLVWRNTMPGHYNCSANSSLLEERYEPPVFGPNSTATQTYSSYGWHNVAPQNAIVKRVFDSVPSLRPLLYLDVHELSNRRADRHHWKRHQLHGGTVVDCLHYCAPGPVDDWNALLATTLLRRKRGEL